jgi:7,8-dihydropterin-6-yl-methyl-4-(beta-D-ribofuranosyl)aminobenzene 5'-phosphate synthase
MLSPRVICVLTALVLSTGAVSSPSSSDSSERARHKVKSLKITILSTMLAEAGVGEWGFAALVEADGRRILFDTGLRPETVLQNARELGIDLSSVTDVVLSHHHGDHTGGLLTLRRELAGKTPTALSRVHVAPGIFSSRRRSGSEKEANPTIEVKSGMEASGAVFVEHREPKELSPGVWLSGPVPRPHPERNWGPPASIVTSGGLVADSIPEDMALIIETDRGLVVVVGCGHAGTVNTVEYGRRLLGPKPLHALIGGLHLFGATDSTLAWTAARLEAADLGYLLGAHCTGIEAVFRIRELAALGRRRAVVAAVGASFDATKGIDPLTLAQ